jgi:chromosome segregation ATPase
MTNENGPRPAQETELPGPREAIVEQGLRIQQETAAERDHLRREVSGLKSDIAGYKVAIEALQTQLADADSRVQTMTLVRDEAVARRAEVETVLASMLALGRAFSIKSEPLIVRTDDNKDMVL